METAETNARTTRTNRNHAKRKERATMKKTILGMALFIICEQATANWKVEQVRDIMDGSIGVWASSENTKPINKMKFPYNDVEAKLSFFCSNGTPEDGVKHGLIQIQLTSLSIDSTSRASQYKQYYLLDTRVKWDKDLEILNLIGEKTKNSLTTEATDTLIQKLMKHNNMILELPWYKQGTVYFNFRLIGASENINKARKICQQE